MSYRGRLLIALKTDLSDSIDTAPSEVENMPTQTINEVISFTIFRCILAISEREWQPYRFSYTALLSQWIFQQPYLDVIPRKFSRRKFRKSKIV